MSFNRLLIRKVLATSLLGLLCAQTVFACGPFTLSAVFTFTVHPEYPLERYAKGELGVVQPTYARSYLFAAYRHLAGVGFNTLEQESLVKLWHERLEYGWINGEDWIKSWKEARQKVPNLAPTGDIDVYRSREQPNEYEQYLNCPSDAFETAAATLNLRIQKYGADSPLISDWVAGQDQVFANCSNGTHIPGSAPTDADSLLRSDRAYQIAAANFYSGHYDEAQNLFAAIGRDKDSPWQSSSQYLVARTFVREASLGPAEGRNEAHAAAEKELHSILNNAAQQQWHSAARRLLNIVLLRHRPEERLNQLAKSLLVKGNESLKQELWDYTVLMDQFVGEDSTERKQPPPSVRQSDLNDWIITLQDESGSSVEHARKQWQSRRSLPWLVVALSKAAVDDPLAPEILTAAAKVTPDSPAYATISFHMVRLMIAAGRFPEARAKLDELLTQRRSGLTVSGINHLERQRLLVATDLRDFLKHAQRVPAAFSWDDDGRELPADESEQSEVSKTFSGKALLDEDAVTLLNRSFPLELWREATLSDVLPPHLRRDVTQAAWLRAVLLGDARTAESLVPTLKAQLPELTNSLTDYASAKTAEAQKFSALYLWLKFPGLEPVVDTGIGRESKPAEQDSYRDNWWCAAAFPPTAEAQQNKPSRMKPIFLTTAQLAAGKAEAKKLEAIGAAPNYLAREVIQWATRAPSDPRVPEALHLAVKSSRFGCTDKNTARWSKAAFDLLHKQYPRSVWAKRTPYWFKD
jgi:hypothetical protein